MAGFPSLIAGGELHVREASRLAASLGVSVACLPIFFVGHAIYRREGVLFLAYYAAYLLYLVLNATEHGTLKRSTSP